MMILVCSHRCTHTHTLKHTLARLCLALSLSKQPFYSERLQWSGSAPAKTPFHTSSLLFSKPSLLCDCRAFLPSFLPPDTEAWGSYWGVRMAGCALIRQTDGRTDRQKDRLTRNRRADRRMLAATVDSGLALVPIRRYNENDIIPVLIVQQEGGGRWRAAGGVWVRA